MLQAGNCLQLTETLLCAHSPAGPLRRDRSDTAPVHCAGCTTAVLSCRQTAFLCHSLAAPKGLLTCPPLGHHRKPKTGQVPVRGLPCRAGACRRRSMVFPSSPYLSFGCCRSDTLSLALEMLISTVLCVLHCKPWKTSHCSPGISLFPFSLCFRAVSQNKRSLVPELCVCCSH